MKLSKKHDVDMTIGSPAGHIFKFSIPLLLGNLFQQLYNTVDSIVVGNFVGKHALGAVGASFPLMMFLVSLFLGFGIAATVMIAQAYGAGDRDRVHRIAQTIYTSSLIGAIPIAVLGYVLSEPILRLMNLPPDGTLQMATAYIRIIFIGLPSLVGYNMNAGVLQGVGDSVSSVRFLITAAIINTILDLIFVIPLQMGVEGAALATIIAQAASFLLGIRYISRHYPYLKLDVKNLQFDRPIFRESLKLGIPSAVQNSLFSVGAMAFGSMVNRYGTDFIAGFNGALKVDNFVFMPVMSFANAVTTYTGQNAGARKIERIRMGRKAGLMIAYATCIIVGIILYPLSETVMKLFTSDPKVLEVGVWYLHAVLPFYFVLATLFIHNGILRGLGKMTVPMVSSFVSLWLGRIPIAYILSKTLGKRYIFYAMVGGWALGSLISMLYFYSGRWKKSLPILTKETQ